MLRGFVTRMKAKVFLQLWSPPVQTPEDKPKRTLCSGSNVKAGAARPKLWVGARGGMQGGGAA